MLLLMFELSRLRQKKSENWEWELISAQVPPCDMSDMQEHGVWGHITWFNWTFARY